jgi:hypothetical protein
MTYINPETHARQDWPLQVAFQSSYSVWHSVCTEPRELGHS